MPDFASRFRNATLPVALAASVAVHVSTFAALVGLDGGPRAAAREVAALPAAPLQVRLVAPATVASPEMPVSVPAIVALASPTPAPLPPSVDATAAKASPNVEGSGERSPVGWKPRVVVNDQVPRARFGEALEGDALAAFLTEVDVGVGLPSRFDVSYPPAALSARKAGSVLVWAVIDDQGAVDSVHVVEGDPDLAAAVEEALPRTRFVPARNLGANVPFYVTLEFEFRLDASGGTVAAERTDATPR